MGKKKGYYYKNNNDNNDNQQKNPSLASNQDANLTSFAKVGQDIKLKDIYADDISAKRRYNLNTSQRKSSLKNSHAVRTAIDSAMTSGDISKLIETSKFLYATNPIYYSIISYLANMFMWKYKVIPHKKFTGKIEKDGGNNKKDDFQIIYNLMLEVVDGLSIETKFPALLTTLLTEGSVFFTTICDEDSINIDTIILPSNYCRKIGETQYGTAIISFNFSYFDDIGVNQEQLKEIFKTFPSEFKKKYNKYKSDSNLQWQDLDSTFSSGLSLNEVGLPTYLYVYGSILDFEEYQDNELERNENLLRYIVVHKMPIFQDKTIFDNSEVQGLHQSLRKIVETGEKARLITTYGEVEVRKIAETENSENQVLSKAFNSIFNNAGFNSGIFTSESVQSLEVSLVRDKANIWKFVKSLLSFYTVAVNNWFDFGDYQADIDILPISSYTYNDDMAVYKDNATLGVNKLDYIIASGIKQRNLSDQLFLEDFLKLNELKPMQTSFTQTAEDRKGEGARDETDKDAENEPSATEEGKTDSTSKSKEVNADGK